MSNNSATSTEEDKNTGMPRKKIRGRVTIIRDRCKGCGYCVEFCPMKALKMSREFNDKGYHFPEVADSQACTGCDLCGMFCPDFAISGCRIPTGAANEEPNKE